jgi:hypothetical protein
VFTCHVKAEHINHRASYGAAVQGIITESVGELLGLVLYAGIAVVLAVLGALTELASVEAISSGQSLFGLWEVAVGALLLYAAYSVATEIVVPGLRGERGPDA